MLQPTQLARFIRHFLTVGALSTVPFAVFARQLVTPIERKYVAAEVEQYISRDLKVFGSVHWNSAATYNSTIEPTPFNIIDDLWLPGGAVGLATGIEFREEKGSYYPGDLAQVGGTTANKSDPTDGRFSTLDVFAELRMPITNNWAVDLAARLSDHSAVGNATTSSAGAIWQVST